jgi:hypothetical protein
MTVLTKISQGYAAVIAGWKKLKNTVSASFGI